MKGAISYAEYRTDDARLTIELIKAARRHGAEALNYMALDRIENDEAEGMRLHCSDKLDGTSYVFDARAVVSAAGPWVDKVRGISEQATSKKLHLTKGVHVVVHKKELPVRSPIYFDTKDGRMIFVIPRDKVCYIGTTDTDYHGDLDNVLCTKEDALYLLDNVNSYFEGISISLANVISSWAGLRPLIKEEGKGPTELSRKDEIFIDSNGLISMAGGKLTGFRMMAKKLVDLLQDKGMVNGLKKCLTRDYQIHADPFGSYEEYQAYVNKLINSFGTLGLNYDTSKYLVDNYGKNAASILSDIDQSNDDFDEALIRKEILFTIRYEASVRPDDFFNRRSGLLYFYPERISKYKDVVIDTFAEYFQWDPKFKDRQTLVMMKLINDSINIV
ncbi:MAG: glycerol-3-phosphate dehydrogenase/oxidase [Saprospiraceae bacterium]|nr:glycerol-3-phosphate dehydrogenase/oxidase [Saprospiraceae bacterium]